MYAYVDPTIEAWRSLDEAHAEHSSGDDTLMVLSSGRENTKEDKSAESDSGISIVVSTGTTAKLVYQSALALSGRKVRNDSRRRSRCGVDRSLR